MPEKKEKKSHRSRVSEEDVNRAIIDITSFMKHVYGRSDEDTKRPINDRGAQKKKEEDSVHRKTRHSRKTARCERKEESRGCGS